MEEWKSRAADYLPGRLAIEVLKVEPDEVIGQFEIEKAHTTWHGYLHGGSVVALADTCCGYGAMRNLNDGAIGFTTVDLASNFLGTALKGKVICSAKPLHLGRSTQLWDATVKSEETGKILAHFRCTQMILWPRS
ncbi:MAG: PaaI family thioesterase [Rhodospirillaceae bacterium]|nr:PaaI family thioesterase [Rhodospirillaceae bacterium]MBT5037473.1 PaaI family thioesterase [Rhodospirillaceae bacterium]MBT5778606.1 PaaI family thioesterase [Rhodospirillaceae bacterium]